jgi:PPK2 family polyphosphate:nucleotide phosphotransferase
MAHSLDTTRYRALPGSRFSLRRHRPDDLPDGMNKGRAQTLLTAQTAKLRLLQETLYAQNEWSLLLVLQGMDAAGKDSLIEHVFSGLNPQGCEVHSFKIPSDEELDHDFLWRTTVRLPRRGHIGIFNRSYYEEVIVVRVHPDLLERQRLPASVATDPDIWHRRYEDITAYERHLVRNGTVIRKIFLHLSREEQRGRMLDRLKEPEKRWKFSAGDIEERSLWDHYQDAYDTAIKTTSTRDAPWYVVPADRKWWARTVVSAIIVEALSALNLAFPQVARHDTRELERIQHALESNEI